MVQIFTQWVIKYRWLVIILSIISAVLLSKGGQNLLPMVNDYRVFFGKENPQLIAFEEMQATYTRNDNIMIALAPKDGNVFTRQTLEAIDYATEKAWQIPYSVRVDSISNFRHTSANGDDLTVEDLYDNASQLNESEITAIKKIALNEPLLINKAISPKAHVAGINIIIELPGVDESKENPKAVIATQALADDIQTRYPDIDVYLTGMIFMNHAFPQAIENDFKTLLPFAFLIIIFGLFISLRNINCVLVTLIVVILSIMSAMGTAGWVGIKMTSPLSSAPTIILTLAIADCVHLLVSFLQAMRHGMIKHDAIIESMRINFHPVMLTSITTSIGFLSMNFSDSPPFHDLGNVSAAGMLYAFFFSIFLVPALLAVLPIKVQKIKEKDVTLMNNFSEFVIRNRQHLLIIMSLISVFFTAFIAKNELNDTFVEYFDTRIEFRRHSDFIASNLSGLYLIDFSIKNNGDNSINDPAFLKKIDQFAQWLRQQPEVIHVNVITDTMRRLNKNMNGDNPDKYTLPESRQLAAQYLLLYEMSLPTGLDLNNQVNIDKSATRVSVTLKTISTHNILELENRVQNWMQANIPSLTTLGASSTVMFAHIGKRNIKSMLIGTSTALVLISFILILTLRSFKYGLISLIPNLLPAAIAFGLWGLFISEVGLALSVVTGMTLGIVVDDTIHFMSKYLRAIREKNLNAEDAIRYAFSNVGVALLITTIVLTGGFLVLAFSAFELNSGMGLLTAITISIALITDFLLLPPLLIKLEGNGSRQA